jgi:predicted Zn-dependent peptidase
LDLPELKRYNLSNNLRLVLVRRTGLPLINLHMTILTGESASPDEKPGLATFTANMLIRGSQDFSFSEIEEGIDSVGGRMVIKTSPDYTEFSFTFLQESLDEALALFSDMLLHPTFSRREIEDLQRSTFLDLTRKRMDADFAGKKLLVQLLFRNHAYQKMAFNDDVIRTYAQGDIRSFYQNFYAPDNALLVVTGNLNLDAATLMVSRYFNSWQEGISERIRVEAPTEKIPSQVCFLEIPRQRDVTIFAGSILPPKTSMDYFPLLVLNQALGGSPISRLFMNLRESKGFAYGAYSFMEFFQASGIFYVRAHVRPEVVGESVEEILDEIRTVSSTPLPSQEIETAKSNLLGQFPLTIETYADMAARIADMEALHLSDEHFENFFDKIISIDAQDVYETARRVSLVPPIVIIVGDQSVLENIGFEKIDVYNNKGEYIHSITKGERQ